jgi:hypothetical protein
MKNILFLFLIISILIVPAHALEIDIEDVDGACLIVLRSEQPVVISSYVLQLNYDTNCSIVGVEQIEPFVTVANIQNAKGYTRIASSSGVSGAASQRTPLVGIVPSGDFILDIIVEELYDDELNLIMSNVLTDSSPNQSYPEYQYESYQSPSYQGQLIPDESRVSWSLPEEILVTVTMPVITPTAIPEIDDDISANVSVDQPLIPSVTQTHPFVVSTSENKTNLPIERNPISILSLFGGLLIVMFITRKAP